MRSVLVITALVLALAFGSLVKADSMNNSGCPCPIGIVNADIGFTPMADDGGLVGFS